MEAKKEDIKIYGKLVNVTTENVVADAEQIWDSYYRKNQTAVNRSMRDDFTKFAKNPTFESAVFTGDSTFQGNMAVDKALQHSRIRLHLMVLLELMEPLMDWLQTIRLLQTILRLWVHSRHLILIQIILQFITC